MERLRVLVVDDNSDGADALGMLVEELGHEVHVTYGGASAFEVATTFRPDLMLVDLMMPDVDGCSLVEQLRAMANFAQTKFVALTGHKNDKMRAEALSAGFDNVFFKPVTLTQIKSTFASIHVAMAKSQNTPSRGSESQLSMESARRLRSQRASKRLTQIECESAIAGAVARFQYEFLGWRSNKIGAFLIKDFVVIRIQGALTRAEQQLASSPTPENGRDLIKQTRRQLLELARPMLSSLISEVTGVKTVSLHHDISTARGEELIIFTLTAPPKFADEREAR